MALKKIKLPDNTVVDVQDSRIPAPAAADNGKVLGVTNTSGTVGWVEQSGGVTDVTVDDVSVVTNGVAEIETTSVVEVTVDTSPTTNSSNLVTSGGVKSALDAKQDTISSSNKLPYSLISDTPTIPSAPGTLNTTATTAQSTNSSEALSGNITLHKVSKTGSYNDLNNKPTIPTVPVISTNITTDATSDTKTASPKAVKDYVDAQIPDDEIYWATYSTTTFAELTTAWNAGKQILCFWSNRVYNLIYVGASYTFGYVWGSTTYRIACNASSEWSNTSNTNQEQITASGLLKGNGSGSVSAAVGGTDYARMSDLPSITLNGTASASPSFYAPTAAGTSGQVLISNGSGAPTWSAPPSSGVTDVTLNDVSIVTNGVAELETESVSTIDLETPVETSYPSGGFRSNKIYDLGTLTGSNTFALYTTGLDSTVKNEWVWSFVAGSTAPTITWPSGITWDGGSAPTVNASCLYEISVRLIGSYYVGYYKEIELS